MAITHIVLVGFKPDAKAEDIAKFCTTLMALKDNCLHATTKKPYIKSLTGGINKSQEGHSDGLTHGFIFELESEEDRQYFIHQDPAHLALYSLAGCVEKFNLLAFVPGVF
ncbi:uncharacterized protein TRIREDRAFT_54622 [Trichoderma reesei QM6a]|uniref:Predicted protein n=2 Tax=Hypocrea jecorina TaxID=51453 RepID=G0R7L2_HYPJQ|nr:uncharacterized protein TRIREDRAFT_54622 [Trichoderma reesei QM6a]EGR53114.1 predicted protein [Trichoderma reesei QM6a]ETR99927.1 stress responsive A/B barrel domain-containing protein [Trichoderma reesei RUT C-30]